LPYIVPGIRVLGLLVGLVLLGLRVVLALQLVGHHDRRVLDALSGHVLGGQARHGGHSAAVRTGGQQAVVVAPGRLVVVVGRGIGSGGNRPGPWARGRGQDVAEMGEPN